MSVANSNEDSCNFAGPPMQFAEVGVVDSHIEKRFVFCYFFRLAAFHFAQRAR
jgi:hypothetical protein